VKEMDSEELKGMNGKDGNPVYVAFGGKVYDVSQSPRWNTGVHMGRHASGQDLTKEMEAAPHGPEVLEKFPQIGTLREAAPSARVRGVPEFLQKAFDRYPLLRRQPHPMTVHFPTRNNSFETTGFYMLCLGLLGSAAAMATGFFAWWVNYGAVLTTHVKYKIALSVVLWVVLSILVIWRFLDPLIIIQSGNLWWIYAILIFALVPLVSLLGHLGGKMVFPG
jgi:predicted heme/steroid binding protein